MTQPFTAAAALSDDELRVAHAQLLGWLEGLFAGEGLVGVLNEAAAASSSRPPRPQEVPGHYL